MFTESKIILKFIPRINPFLLINSHSKWNQLKVFRDLADLPKFKQAVLTIGTFDGVHKGHQKLLEKINFLAKKMDGESVVITFHPHPRLLIGDHADSLKLLNTIEEKETLLSQYGVDNLVIIPFSRAFSELSADAYIHDFLIEKFAPKGIVIGYDHKFGKNRLGDFNLLNQKKEIYNFELFEINKETQDSITISSTKIRSALQQGEIQIANDLLGHRYLLTGLVVKGFQNGRKLGYPTANIQCTESTKLVPKTGIYAVLVHYQNSIYKGMLSIGFNPTFEGKTQTIEVHILDFNQEIYGEILTLEFISFVREEKKFDNLPSLIEAIDGDKKIITELLAEI